MSSFNEFVKFISEDPIMLGLCGAIVALVIIFILVLLFGGRGKQNNKEEKLDNTTNLLKNSINDEPLKSTQEFTLNGLEETQKVESVEELVNSELEKTVPISIDEAMTLKKEREDSELKDTIEIPVLNEEEKEELVVPTINEEVELPKQEVNLESTLSANQPFSSVVINSGDELPKIDESESNTEIIRHVPVEEKPVEENVVDESLDDIDLPKLNTNEDTSIINSLTGESFKI